MAYQYGPETYGQEPWQSPPVEGVQPSAAVPLPALMQGPPDVGISGPPASSYPAAGNPMHGAYRDPQTASLDSYLHQQAQAYLAANPAPAPPPTASQQWGSPMATMQDAPGSTYQGQSYGQSTPQQQQPQRAQVPLPRPRPQQGGGQQRQQAPLPQQQQQSNSWAQQQWQAALQQRQQQQQQQARQQQQWRAAFQQWQQRQPWQQWPQQQALQAQAQSSAPYGNPRYVGQQWQQHQTLWDAVAPYFNGLLTPSPHSNPRYGM